MIKIIKHGKQEKFKTTCPNCGCEFEYQLEDTEIDYNLCLTSLPPQYRRYVTCPECGYHIIHDDIIDDKYNSLILRTYLTSDNTSDNKDDPCETCPNKDGPKDVFGHPVAGDSPCQWCKHYKWKITW